MSGSLSHKQSGEMKMYSIDKESADISEISSSILCSHSELEHLQTSLLFVSLLLDCFLLSRRSDHGLFRLFSEADWS